MAGCMYPILKKMHGADGLKCDTAGRVYVATRLGIQVMDQLGRVNAIIAYCRYQMVKLPTFVLAGPEFNILYVSAGDKVFRRKLKTRGANTFDKPIKPANPRL